MTREQQEAIERAKEMSAALQAFRPYLLDFDAPERPAAWAVVQEVAQRYCAPEKVTQ